MYKYLKNYKYMISFCIYFLPCFCIAFTRMSININLKLFKTLYFLHAKLILFLVIFGVKYDWLTGLVRLTLLLYFTMNDILLLHVYYLKERPHVKQFLLKHYENEH